MAVKIDRIRLYPFEIPLKRPFRIATMVNRSAKGVFVEVLSGGLAGWGECLPFHAINGETAETCIAALKFLGSISELEIEPAGAARRFLELLPTQTTAISGLEMALWDVAAQQANQPLWQLLGGQNLPIQTDATIGICELQTAKEWATEYVDQGFDDLKIKLGESPESDAARVRAIRDTFPHVTIRVDANQGYLRHEALQMLERIAEFDIQFCEQPVPRGDLEGLAWLHGNSPVPIMADESCFSPSDAFHLTAQRICSLVNVKLCKSAGIQTAREIAAIMRASYGQCMMGGMAETRLGVTAAACVASSDPAFRFADLDAHLGHQEDHVEGGLEIRGGKVFLPTDPGLGARPAPRFLESLRVIEIVPAFD